MELSYLDNEELEDFVDQEFFQDSQPGSISLTRKHTNPRRLIEILNEQKQLSEKLGELFE